MLQLLKALAFLLGHMPLALATLSGRLLGGLGYRLLKKHRKIALANLELAFGKTLSGAERERIAKAVFRNLATMLFEFTRIPWLGRSDVERLRRITRPPDFRTGPQQGK